MINLTTIDVFFQNGSRSDRRRFRAYSLAVKTTFSKLITRAIKPFNALPFALIYDSFFRFLFGAKLVGCAGTKTLVNHTLEKPKFTRKTPGVFETTKSRTSVADPSGESVKFPGPVIPVAESTPETVRAEGKVD